MRPESSTQTVEGSAWHFKGTSAKGLLTPVALQRVALCGSLKEGFADTTGPRSTLDLDLHRPPTVWPALAVTRLIPEGGAEQSTASWGSLGWRWGW